jgi:hypothetical protein
MAAAAVFSFTVNNFSDRCRPFGLMTVLAAVYYAGVGK